MAASIGVIEAEFEDLIGIAMGHRVRAASTNKKMSGCEEKTCSSLRHTRSYGWAEA